MCKHCFRYCLGMLRYRTVLGRSPLGYRKTMSDRMSVSRRARETADIGHRSRRVSTVETAQEHDRHTSLRVLETEKFHGR